MGDEVIQLLASKIDSKVEPVVVLLTGGHWIGGFVSGISADSVSILPPDGGSPWTVRLTQVVAARVAEDHQNGGVDLNRA